MSQIRPSTQLKALKAPRWRVGVPDLKDIYPWVNIWKLASKDPGLKSWGKFRFWTWSVQQILTPKKHLFCPQKRMVLWETFTIANNKAYKQHLKTCIFIDFSTYRLKVNGWSQKIALLHLKPAPKKIWVGTRPNSQPKKKICWCQILNSNQKDFEISHSVVKCYERYKFVDDLTVLEKIDMLIIGMASHNPNNLNS